jgi:hypothetical protein
MHSLKKVSEFTLPRKAVYWVCIFMGILTGIVNSFLQMDFSLTFSLVGWLLAAIIIVVSLHEGIHGAVAALFGHKPLFGFKPPLVYITFTSTIPRDHFILVALAPFFVLDLLFGLLYARGLLKLFSNFCFTINTIGAVGDVWVAIKLLGAPKGTVIQDTKTGFEVWAPDKA